MNKTKSPKQIKLNQTISLEDIQEQKELFEIFTQFDTDNSGSISVEEWKQAMKRFGHEATQEQVQEMLREFGIQHKREFDFNDFIRIIKKKRLEIMGHENAELSKAFRLFDKDLDGELNAKQLKCGLQKMGETMCLEDLQLLVAMAGKSHMGAINFQQFSRIMKLT